MSSAAEIAASLARMENKLRESLLAGDQGMIAVRTELVASLRSRLRAAKRR